MASNAWGKDTVHVGSCSVGLSMSKSTCTGTCGFIRGKTCTYRSPVCSYLALKLPMSTGVDFGMSKYSQSTHAQSGAHLGARLSCHLKICHWLSSTLPSPHPHHLTHSKPRVLNPSHLSNGSHQTYVHAGHQDHCCPKHQHSHPQNHAPEWQEILPLSKAGGPW